MIMVRVDECFYMSQYLADREPLIKSGFSYYARRAGQQMDYYIPSGFDGYEEEARFCCCEIAEEIFRYDNITGGVGAPLVSYSNDGQSGQFDMTNYTKEGHQRKVYGIIRRYFDNTGLLFQGVGG